MQAELERRRFTLLQRRCVRLGTHPLDHLFHPGRVDTAVDDQLLDDAPGDLAAVRVETGKDDRARRVVDDQLDTRRGSSARMLRPSRPMNPSFMSSLGRSTTDTVVSTAWSGALR